MHDTPAPDRPPIAPHLPTHSSVQRFHFDPFATRPREECTVGALRGRVTD